MTNVLDVENMSVSFSVRGSGWKSRQVGVVDRVSFSIAPGEIVGLVGESGSGKSTTARALLRLIPTTGDGTIMLHGVDITSMSERELRHHRRHAQMVFQDPYSSLDPSMTVAALLHEAIALDGATRTKQQRRDRALELLIQVGLGEVHLDRYPAEFSGGQRQRVAIARALASNPKLIVCDEAVSALDVSTQRQIVRLLQRLRTELGVAILFIAHDLAVVRQIADRTIVMYCGQIVEESSSQALFSAPAHPYTVALLSAVPIPASVRQQTRRRLILAGDAPNPAAPPSGCRFHERCPFQMDICRTVEPTSTPTTGGTVRCHLHDGRTLPWQFVDGEVFSAASVSVAELDADVSAEPESGRAEDTSVPVVG